MIFKLSHLFSTGLDIAASQAPDWLGLTRPCKNETARSTSVASLPSDLFKFIKKCLKPALQHYNRSILDLY